MADTTRKIPDEDILLLDEVQLHFKRRGMPVSQKQLISESIKFAAEHEKELIQRLHRNHKDNTKEMTERFLKRAKSIDFGKNWMEELDIVQ
jgi:predicted solute-binding protein